MSVNDDFTMEHDGFNLEHNDFTNGDLINDAKLEAPTICKAYVKVM